MEDDQTDTTDKYYGSVMVYLDYVTYAPTLAPTMAPSLAPSIAPSISPTQPPSNVCDVIYIILFEKQLLYFYLRKNNYYICT